MMLVKVWTDVGARKPVQLLAKIINNDGVIYTIKYLSETDDKIWRYEDDVYDIDDKSIAEYLNTENEEDIGFLRREDGFVKVDSDEDYEPSEEDDSSDEYDEQDVETEEDEEEYEDEE